MIRLLFFAKLREDLGRSEEAIALPSGVGTARALREHLAGRGGEWAEALAPHRALRLAVNQEMARAETPVRDGDEVAFFPPVTGG